MTTEAPTTPAPAAPLSAEVNRAATDVVERVLSALSGRVFSPRIKLLDLNQVMEATGLKKTAIYDGVKAGTFPAPMKDLGKNLWRESSLIAWMDAKDPNHGKEWR